MEEPIFSHICDRCGCPIEGDETRYIAQIRVYAAPSRLNISAEELAAPPRETMEELIRQCSKSTPEEAMREVNVEFKLDLCARCQREYVRDPVPKVDP